MFTATITPQTEPHAGLLAGTLSQPLPDLTADFSAELSFPIFNYTLTAPLLELSAADGFQQLTLKLGVDQETLLVCTLHKPKTNNGAEPSVAAAISFEAAAPRPRAVFVTSTLQALCGLAETIRLRLPALRLDAPLQLAERLGESNQMLRRRLLAEWAMLIEAAFQQTLLMPAVLTRAQEDLITFVHHALRERTFDWPFFEGAFLLRADEATHASVQAGNDSGMFQLAVARWEEELFGRKLALGPAVVTVKQAVLLNATAVSRELEQLDGHEFQAVIRSQAGFANFVFADLPPLPELEGAARLKELSALGKPLNDLLWQKVNGLAAGSLANLTEEEKAELTARPELDEEAFLFADLEGEI